MPLHVGVFMHFKLTSLTLNPEKVCQEPDSMQTESSQPPIKWSSIEIQVNEEKKKGPFDTATRVMQLPIGFTYH